MTLKPVILAGLALFAPTVAHAQYQMISPMLYNGPRISLQNHAARARRATPSPRRGVPDTGSRAVPANDADTPVYLATMRYRPDLARRRANLAQFVAKTRAADPAAADELARLFADGTFFDNMAAALAPMGLRVDDVSDAYSTYWINAYQATQGHNRTPSRRKIEAVKLQAAGALADTAEFRNASDAHKQEMAEALWIQAALIDGAVEYARGRPDDLITIGKAAAQGAHAMGLDVTVMTLTEDGFLPTTD